jgi:hypothetical protein
MMQRHQTTGIPRRLSLVAVQLVGIGLMISGTVLLGRQPPRLRRPWMGLGHDRAADEPPAHGCAMAGGALAAVATNVA